MGKQYNAFNTGDLMRIFKIIVLCLLMGFSALSSQEFRPLKFLITFTPHSNSEELFRALDTYTEKLSYTQSYHFLINCDENDDAFNNQDVIERLQSYANIQINFIKNWTWVKAQNYLIDELIDLYDCVIVANEQQIPEARNFDIPIAEQMLKNFPTLDGVITMQAPMPHRGYHEYRADLLKGHISIASNSLYIIGKNYYQRFNHVYFPGYNESFYAHEELGIISKILRKEYVIYTIFTASYERSNNNQDYDLFKSRRLGFYDLPEAALQEAMPLDWSILICTIEGREQCFEYITNKLWRQIEAAGLQDKIEILVYKDKRGEHTTGHKRSVLLNQSKGKYVCCVDDDDDLHDEYVSMIYNAILDDKDCVSLVGIRTHNGQWPSIFIHSAQYDDYFTKDGIDYRPPNHLNPLKRAIGIQFLFPNITISEDSAWTFAIAASKIVQTESVITTPYYFYKYVDK